MSHETSACRPVSVNAPARPERPFATRLTALCLVAAGCLLPACGHSDTFVPVSFLIDADTCAATPGEVTLGCDTAVGVWLRDQDGTTLQQACFDLDSTRAAGETLDEICPAISKGRIDLSGITAQKVTLEVESSPPRPARSTAAPAHRRDRPRAAVWGQSDLTTLERANTGLFVSLTCQLPDGVVNTCYDACDTRYCLCFDQGIAAACTDQLDTCQAACTDDECRARCQDEYATCTSGGDTSICQSDLDVCLAGCTDQTCMDQCQADYAACVQGARLRRHGRRLLHYLRPAPRPHLHRRVTAAPGRSTRDPTTAGASCPARPAGASCAPSCGRGRPSGPRATRCRRGAPAAS